jgi:hypothetical protein
MPEVAQPLPECVGCETPTRRETWQATGGLCTACGDALRREAALASRGLVPLFEDGQL